LVGCRKSYCKVVKCIICEFLISFLCVAYIIEMKYLISMTIGFNMCTTIFIYAPSVPSEWSGLFIPLNVTVASVMACRLFRELKLDHFVDPMAEGVISKIVNRDIGSIPQQQSGHALELQIFGDEGADTAIRTEHGISGEESGLAGNIDLEARRSKIHA